MRKSTRRPSPKFHFFSLVVFFFFPSFEIFFCFSVTSFPLFVEYFLLMLFVFVYTCCLRRNQGSSRGVSPFDPHALVSGTVAEAPGLRDLFLFPHVPVLDFYYRSLQAPGITSPPRFRPLFVPLPFRSILNLRRNRATFFRRFLRPFFFLPLRGVFETLQTRRAFRRARFRGC